MIKQVYAVIGSSFLKLQRQAAERPVSILSALAAITLLGICIYYRQGSTSSSSNNKPDSKQPQPMQSGAAASAELHGTNNNPTNSNISLENNLVVPRPVIQQTPNQMGLSHFNQIPLMKALGSPETPAKGGKDFRTEMTSQENEDDSDAVRPPVPTIVYPTGTRHFKQIALMKGPSQTGSAPLGLQTDSQELVGDK